MDVVPSLRNLPYTSPLIERQRLRRTVASQRRSKIRMPAHDDFPYQIADGKSQLEHQIRSRGEDVDFLRFHCRRLVLLDEAIVLDRPGHQNQTPRAPIHAAERFQDHWRAEAVGDERYARRSVGIPVDELRQEPAARDSLVALERILDAREAPGIARPQNPTEASVPRQRSTAPP